MSVVVRMEMPRNCHECPVSHQSFGDTPCWCKLAFEKNEAVSDGLMWREVDPQTRPDWCPIICQLSDGHGRPGDLDELKNWLVAQIEHYKRFDYGAICSTMVSAYETVCKVIDSMTAIGPTEAESPSPKPTDPLPIRGVEYVPTEVDVQTGTVTYELRERKETCLD